MMTAAANADENVEMEVCPLCGRELAPPITRHHLIPKSRGGKGTDTYKLHKICHDKIHRVFTEKELARYYNSFERIRQDAEIQAFIEWIRKKDPDFFDISHRKKSQRR